jgi:hypothetical protein
LRKNRVFCPICNRTYSRSIIYQHFDRHVQELLRARARTFRINRAARCNHDAEAVQN